MPPQVSMTPEQIAAYQAQPNEWMRAVLGGEFLGSNPYINQLIQTMEADAQRQFQEATLPLARSEYSGGGRYTTALGEQATANTARDFAQGLMGQTAGIRYQDYGAERENMMRALGLLSGETAASRQGLFGARDTDVQAETAIQQANIGRSGQLGAARIGANAQMASARMAQQAAYWKNLFNRSEQMRGYTGGQPGSIGSRAPEPTTPFVPPGKTGSLGAQGGLWGGPAGGPVKWGGDMGNSWNSPGAW